MWPLAPIKNELVTITLSPQYITCSWIQPHNKRTPFALAAYQKTALDHLELEQSIIFNPTKIQQYINNFLEQYNLNNAFVACSCAGPGIREKIITLNIASPKPKDLTSAGLKKIMWDYRYLHPVHNNQFAFYVCGISRELLFQYKLLAIALGINLTTITTEFMALLHLYKYLYGNAFRYSQLAIDMQKHNNKLEKNFTHETIRRMLHISSDITLDLYQEAPFLLKSLGLLLTGEQYT